MDYTVPQTFTFDDNLSYTRKLTGDTFVKFVTPVPCEGCTPFFMPFVSGDVYHYQFNEAVQAVQFFDPGTDEEFISTAAIISGNTFKLDMSRMTKDCFYIKINGDCRLQHGYVRAETDCGRATVLLESDYDTVDFLGNDYTLNGYSNRTRVFAELEFIEEETETEENSDGEVTLHRIRDVYELRFMDYIENNSWMLTNLLKAVLRGENLRAAYKGDIYYFDRFTEAVSKQNDINESWLPLINLKTNWIEKDLKC